MRRAFIPVLMTLAGCGQTIVWSQEYSVLDEDVWEAEEGDRYENQFFCQEGQSGTAIDDCESEQINGGTGVRKGEVCTRSVDRTDGRGRVRRACLRVDAYRRDLRRGRLRVPL